MQSADNLSQPGTASPQSTVAERIAGSRYLGLSAFLFAFLQTLCPAVIALSAVRVFIGLGALAAAAGTMRSHAGGMQTGSASP